MNDSELPDLDKMFSAGLQYTVDTCPRCEGEHPGLMFQPFGAEAEFTHWVLCPTSHEPILMNVELL
jgi:hypothetical protein